MDELPRYVEVHQEDRRIKMSNLYTYIDTMPIDTFVLCLIIVGLLIVIEMQWKREIT